MSRERIINQTKSLLKENLIELLDKKPLSKITIKELCERADINRTTYYRYYLDQYDQLEKIEDELFVDISAYIYEAIDKDDVDNVSLLVDSILNYMNEHKYEFKVLLQKGDNDFQTKFLSYIGKLIFKVKPNTLEEELNFIYVSQGNFGVVKEWICGNIDISLEELKKFILNNYRKISH